jgi:hypothetical protein
MLNISIVAHNMCVTLPEREPVMHDYYKWQVNRYKSYHMNDSEIHFAVMLCEFYMMGHDDAKASLDSGK